MLAHSLDLREVFLPPQYPGYRCLVFPLLDFIVQPKDSCRFAFASLSEYKSELSDSLRIRLSACLCSLLWTQPLISKAWQQVSVCALMQRQQKDASASAMASQKMRTRGPSRQKSTILPWKMRLIGYIVVSWFGNWSTARDWIWYL